MESPHFPDQFQPNLDAAEQPEPSAIDVLAKEKHRQLFQRGLMWLGGGVAFMGLSFCINFLLFHSDASFTTTMYVLTSLGAACIVKGLADIMGF